jgi:hypothetical protein
MERSMALAMQTTAYFACLTCISGQFGINESGVYEAANFSDLP